MTGIRDEGTLACNFGYYDTFDLLVTTKKTSSQNPWNFLDMEVIMIKEDDKCLSPFQLKSIRVTRATNANQISVGTFYNVVEKNSAQRDSQLARFDMRNPAPGSSSPGPIVTERVTVPSSQHVAEIVGRQGKF